MRGGCGESDGEHRRRREARADLPLLGRRRPSRRARRAAISVGGDAHGRHRRTADRRKRAARRSRAARRRRRPPAIRRRGGAAARDRRHARRRAGTASCMISVDPSHRASALLLISSQVRTSSARNGIEPHRVARGLAAFPDHQSAPPSIHGRGSSCSSRPLQRSARA